LVKSVQEINLNISSDSFATTIFTNIKTKIGGWLADATNGITDIFAKQVNTNTLCVSDDSGAKTCITKTQLDALLAPVPSLPAPAAPVPVSAVEPPATSVAGSSDAKAIADKAAADKAAADLEAQKIADAAAKAEADKIQSEADAKVATDKTATEVVPPSP
jgi:hypothetical protein